MQVSRWDWIRDLHFLHQNGVISAAEMHKTIILFAIALGAAPAWGQADVQRDQCYGSKASADS